MRRADVAMYVAKGERTGIEVYDAARDPNSPTRLGTVAALREALDHDRPRAALPAQGEPRRRHGRRASRRSSAGATPSAGCIPPDEFVPLAERTGLVHRLTEYVLARGARPGRRTGGATGCTCRSAVNVSMRDLQETDLAALVVAELDPTGCRRERARCSRSPRACWCRTPARPWRPCASSPTSASPARSTTSAPATPRCCCSSSCPSPRSRSTARSCAGSTSPADDPAMVRSIVGFAHGLGLSVVAEGVESSAAWKALRDMDCDVAQGFRVARPMPATQATQWLVERVVRGPAERAGLRRGRQQRDRRRRLTGARPGAVAVRRMTAWPTPPRSPGTTSRTSRVSPASTCRPSPSTTTPSSSA